MSEVEPVLLNRKIPLMMVAIIVAAAPIMAARIAGFHLNGSFFGCNSLASLFTQSQLYLQYSALVENEQEKKVE